jgi:peptidyl-tRNA hydrolase
MRRKSPLVAAARSERGQSVRVVRIVAERTPGHYTGSMSEITEPCSKTGAGGPSAVKLVIAVRRDLHMTRGKEIAQACHAAVGVLLNESGYVYDERRSELNHVRMDGQTLAWLEGGAAKICVKVDSEAELYELERKAGEAGIRTCLIIDDGLTMFHGVKTPTCIAVGPAESEKIDGITGGLPLY